MKTKNLTIQEAIKSGLPFKREDWSGYMRKFDKENPFLIWEKNEATVPLHQLDILATDWEIKVPEVTITREKLAEAIAEADRIYSCTSKDGQKLYVDFISKKLGI